MAIKTYTSGDLPTSNQYVVFVTKAILNSQSIVNNTSSGMIQFIFRRKNTGYVTAGAGTVYGQWGGNTYTEETTINDRIVYASQGAGIVLFSKPFTVQHDELGRGSLTVKGRISIPGANLGGDYQSFSVSLPTIARQSSVSTPDLVVGQDLAVGISRNYIEYTHDIELNVCDGAVVKTISGAEDSAVFEFDQADIDAIYQALPNSTEGAYTLSCTTYNGSTAIGTVNANGKVLINIADALPVFSSFNISADTSGLTGSTNTIVIGVSNVTVTIPQASKATSTTYATIQKYAVSIGNTAKEVAYSDSADVSVTFNNVTSGTVIVSAVDSRGAQKAVTSVFSTIDYTAPRISQARIDRNNSIDSEATLSFSGLWWNGNFGSQQNTISAWYQYKETNAADYSAKQALALTVSGNSFTFSGEVNGDLGAQGFDVEKSYSVLISIEDAAQFTGEQTIVLDRGIPTMHMTQQGVSVGQMMPSGLPSGVVNAATGYSINGEALPDVGTILLRYDHISPASIFGGTWERLANTFLYGVSAEGIIGDTGGESTHTLTVDEMPSHRHSSKSLPAEDLEGGYSVMRSDTFSAQSDTVSYTAYTGGGAAHNNMPPYTNISIWRRVA